MSNTGEEKEIDESSAIDLAGQIHLNAASISDSNKPPTWMWFGVAGLTIIALLVIFVLPPLVSRYQLPLEPRIDTSQIQQNRPTTDSGVSEISPFEQAQRARQRKEAQDVLAELLGLQSELERQKVDSWAISEFEAALDTAALGDGFYREQDFVKATETYSEGLVELQEILDSVDAVFQNSLEQAEDAFNRSDAAMAIDGFTLAVLLDPSSEDASIGLERALVLDQVLTLINSAEQLLEDNDLAEAKRAYEEVSLLDRYNESAKRSIDQISQLMLEADFSRRMSIGYEQLQMGDAEQAIAQFESATDLGVNEEQALAAIKQAENEIANGKITAIREHILSSESQENWQQAVTHYDSVLEIDSNIVFAVEGRDYASKRAQLNDLLVRAIAGPERFYEEDVFQQTLDIYYTGREVEKQGGGSVLAGQLDQLEQLLETSQIPIEIQFASDNLTDVTILRVENLGLFEKTSMALKPGRYVAQGKRIGYRETRTEFVVGFGQTPNIVNVRCTERVVPTNR